MPMPLPGVSMRLGRPELVPGRSSARLAPRDPQPLSTILAAPMAATTITMSQNHIHMAGSLPQPTQTAAGIAGSSVCPEPVSIALMRHISA